MIIISRPVLSVKTNVELTAYAIPTTRITDELHKRGMSLRVNNHTGGVGPGYILRSEVDVWLAKSETT
jgi:hypothetical protein